jgi:hypothetical protein
VVLALALVAFVALVDESMHERSNAYKIEGGRGEVKCREGSCKSAADHEHTKLMDDNKQSMSRPRFVLPIFSRALKQPPEQIDDEHSLPTAPFEFSSTKPLREKLQKNFPERLWRAAIASGESEAEFWVNGARFADDGCHIFYCASILGAHLGIKPSTIAHNIRGYLGTEKPRRITKKTFDRLFGTSIPYRGQVWIIRIPGLDITTRDFLQFRWGVMRTREAEDVTFDRFVIAGTGADTGADVGADDGADDGADAGAASDSIRGTSIAVGLDDGNQVGIEMQENSNCCEWPELENWPCLEQNSLSFDELDPFA